MVGTFPESWEEVCWVSIILKGGTARNFAAMTETVDISEPDYPGESINNVAGGRIWKQSPQEDGEITFEIYPIELDTASNDKGLFQQFAGGSWDVAEPLATDTTWAGGVDRPRDKYMVGILWTDDTSHAYASDTAFTTVNGTDKVALRFYAKECRMTSHKADFTDGILKITATFKFPAMNKAGTTKSYAWESTDDADTSPLPALTYA